MKIRYFGNGQECCVYCEDEAFLIKLHQLFEGFEVIDSNDNGCLVYSQIHVIYIKEGKYCVIHEEVKEVWNIEQALGYVVKTVLGLLGKEINKKYFLHGGCVQYRGKNNCFLGKTKSGKSTLTYFLCHEPYCQYITDDLICIDESLNCVPFLKPIFIRDSKYIEDCNNITVIQYQDEYRYCTMPEHKIAKNELYKIENIFIVERNPMKEFTVERLSVSAAFINIWQNMYKSEFIYDKRNIALIIAKSTNVFKLNYRDVTCDLKMILGYMK